VTTYVSGEGSSVCAAGERLVLRMQFIDADTVFFNPDLHQTDCPYYQRPTVARALAGAYARFPEE